MACSSIPAMWALTCSSCLVSETRSAAVRLVLASGSPCPGATSGRWPGRSRGGSGRGRAGRSGRAERHRGEAHGRQRLDVCDRLLGLGGVELGLFPRLPPAAAPGCPWPRSRSRARPPPARSRWRWPSPQSPRRPPRPRAGRARERRRVAAAVAAVERSSAASFSDPDFTPAVSPPPPAPPPPPARSCRGELDGRPRLNGPHSARRTR